MTHIKSTDTFKWQCFFIVTANKYYLPSEYRHKPNSKNTRVSILETHFFPFAGKALQNNINP